MKFFDRWFYRKARWCWHRAGVAHPELKAEQDYLDKQAKSHQGVALPIERDSTVCVSNEIDLDQLIRDTLVVELPLAPACGTSTCTNFSSEVVESGDTSSGLRDLRWGALSELEF